MFSTSASFASALVLVLLAATSSSAAPTPVTNLPYNVANPGATPAYYSVPLPSLLPYSTYAPLIGATSGSAVFSALSSKRQIAVNSASNPKCLDSSYDDSDINSLFAAGKNGTTVYLCPSATLLLLNPIQFTAPFQTLVTLGRPTDSTRATLVVMGAYQTAAVIMSCNSCSYSALRNVILDGSRPLLGHLNLFASALVEMGGNTVGQVVDSIQAFEPRGWSCLHAIEGNGLTCNSVQITNNQIGPCGHGPSAGFNQEKKRDTGVHLAGEWADGISLSCANATVTGNTVTDATDGAIVIFGAPGSLVDSNTIVANARNVMGGINMVDLAPWPTFNNTLVSNNNLFSNGSMIKNGIAMGPMVWGSVDYGRASGGAVVNNTFSSGSTGYFSYGVSIAGFNGAAVSGSKFVNAKFSGVASNNCPHQTPTPAPLLVDMTVSPGSILPVAASTNNTLGAWSTASNVMFLICNAPGGTVSTYTS